MKRLFVLIFRIGVRYDAASHLEIYLAAFYYEGTYDYGGVHIPVETYIADSPGIGGSPDRFQLVYYLHRPYLGRSRYGAAGKRRAQAGYWVRRFIQPARYRRYHMKDVGVFLYHRGFDGPDRAVFAYSAQVVSLQVDYHNMLGHVLSAFGKLCLHRGVL
jgi:hypothetical protein